MAIIAKQAYFISPPIVTDGLVMLLDAGDRTSYPGSGATWTDLTRNTLNGSLLNTPTFTLDGGGSIECNGTNESVLIADNSLLDFGSGSFTVEYWFKKLRNTLSFSDVYGVAKWTTGADPGTNEWTLSVGNGTSGQGNTDEWRFSVEVGSTTYTSGYAPSQIVTGSWNQLIGQRDGNTLNLYQNGVLVRSTVPVGFTAASVVNNVGRALRIATSGELVYFTKGNSAIVRIYNRALSQAEITQNYNAHKARFGLS